MKTLTILAAVAAFAIFAVADLIHDFTANDPIGYFRQDPSRLLTVAGIAITGGLVALLFYRLPPRTQKQVKLLGWAAAATGCTAAVGYFGFISFSLGSLISRAGGSIRPLLLTVLPFLFLYAAVSAGCWYGCWRLWKSGVWRRN